MTFALLPVKSMEAGEFQINGCAISYFKYKDDKWNVHCVMIDDLSLSKSDSLTKWEF